MTSHEELVESWIRSYARVFPENQKYETSIYNAVVARMKDDGLNFHQVRSRTKDLDSLRKKLLKSVNGTPKYSAGVQDIDDLIGIRIITFLHTDIGSVVSALKGKFDCIEDIDKTEQTKDSGAIGYGGRHLVLKVPQIDPPEGCKTCVGQRFEVQIRTVLQHAWAEFEHDIRYKGQHAIPPRAHRAFSVAGALIDLADQQFALIQELLVDLDRQATSKDSTLDSQQSEPLTGEKIQELLLRRLPNHPRSRAEQYSWLAELARANEISTIAEAEELFSEADWQGVADRMKYRFDAGHVRIADDFMLQKWGEKYIERTANLGEDPQRTGKLKSRLSKLRPAA